MPSAAVNTAAMAVPTTATPRTALPRHLDQHWSSCFTYEMVLRTSSPLLPSLPSMNSVPREWNYPWEGTLPPRKLPLLTGSLQPRCRFRGKGSVLGSLRPHIIAPVTTGGDSCPSLAPETQWAEAVTLGVAWGRRHPSAKGIFILHVTKHFTHLHLLHRHRFPQLPP